MMDYSIEYLLRQQAKIRARIRAIYRKGGNAIRMMRSTLDKLYANLGKLEEKTKSSRCHRCHRDLSAEKSVVHGYGATCFSRLFGTVPWVDLVEMVRAIKLITGLPLAGEDVDSIAQSLNAVEVAMLDDMLRDRERKTGSFNNGIST